MRGKLSPIALNAKSSRITPAGAGKTFRSRYIGLRKEDHPRRCGENVTPFRQECYGVGSPPQVRGKPATTALDALDERITPAGAGKTGTTTMMTKLPRDHPRRCGENKDLSPNIGRGRGSPPQVRGKPRIFQRVRADSRITPAGAGKTKTRSAKLRQQIGSPPQVRGKRLCPTCNWRLARITPAGAGKTSRGARRSRKQRDHPRRCGENSVTRYGLARPLRITPAGAGKTAISTPVLQPK